MSGSIAMYKVDPQGKLSNATCSIQHEGFSINLNRQKGPHAHAVILSADERFLFVPDLGIDAIVVYEIDYEHDTLVLREDLKLESRAGSGPRSITFHKTLPYAYCINELDSTIDVNSYDSESGKLTFIQSYSTLPIDYTGESTCADIRISSCGNYLLGSNRGHDSLVCYKIDTESGLLTTLNFTPTGGKCPRNFFTYDSAILVANQDSDRITIFSLSDGNVEDTGNCIEVPTPVCINNRNN
jgi:6-phosphogluconolactonase